MGKKQLTRTHLEIPRDREQTEQKKHSSQKTYLNTIPSINKITCKMLHSLKLALFVMISITTTTEEAYLPLFTGPVA